jgi:undecaprenyl diphosphate synthase
MDGNGRWAKARNLPRTEGHARGEASLFDVIEGAIEVGVKYLSAYAFSTENWNRSPDEVRWLMGFNRDVIRRRRDQLDAMGVRVRWAGRRPRLWRSVISELEDAERRTVGNEVLTLQFCVNYGGRAEIVDATRRIALLAAEGRLDPRKLTEERFRHFLDEPGFPMSTCSFARPGSSERRTSCCGRVRTPSWSSLIDFGLISTAVIFGERLRRTPSGTGATAARCPMS